MVDVPPRALVADVDVVVLQAGGSADGGAQGHSGAPGLVGVEVEAGVGHRLARRDQGELDVPVVSLRLAGAEPVVGGVEVDLGGYPGAEPGRVEEGDAPCRGPPVGEQVPEGAGADATGGDDADPGHGHPSAGHATTSECSGGRWSHADSCGCGASSVSTWPSSGRGRAVPGGRPSGPRCRRRCGNGGGRSAVPAAPGRRAAGGPPRRGRPPGRRRPRTRTPRSTGGSARRSTRPGP